MKTKVFLIDSSRDIQLTTMDFDYFDGAIKFLQEAIELDSKIALQMKKLEEESAEYDKDDRESYIYQSTLDDRMKLTQLCIVSMLFSCMTVESFINKYGVLRMGDEFYKRNIERSGISQKLETIIAIGTQELLSKNEELAILTRRMFDKRNQLVHPKTSELNSRDQISQLRPLKFIDDAQSMLEDMKKFFENFQKIDPDSWAWIPGKHGFITKDD